MASMPRGMGLTDKPIPRRRQRPRRNTVIRPRAIPITWADENGRGMGDLTGRVINQLRQHSPPKAARNIYEKTPLPRAPQSARLDQSYNGYELEPLGEVLVCIITAYREFNQYRDIPGTKSECNHEVKYKIKKMLKLIQNPAVFTDVIIMLVITVLSVVGCLPAQARNRSSSH